MENFSGIKGNKLLIYTSTQTSLKNMSSEISQTQKITCCMFPFIWNIHKRQIIRQKAIKFCLGPEVGIGICCTWGWEMF